MKNITFAALILLAAAFAAPGGEPEKATPDRGKAEHVVMVVWDGMRPDFITEQTTPTLYKLSQGGVFFKKNHSTYVTSTEVNGTVLATGMFPSHSHVIANKEYRPALDPLKPVAMEIDEVVRKADEIGKHIAVPTLEETLQVAGKRTVIAGTKAVAILPDRSRDRVSEGAKKSAVIYSGKSNPPLVIADATTALGAPFPPEVNFPNASEDAWTTRALTEYLWKDGVPEFSLLWMSDPDFSQHNTAPGSPIALGALKSVDENLAHVLAALDARGIRNKTDIIVVSDHGFSTIDKSNDVVTALNTAGFSAASKFTQPPKPGDIMVVGVGGTVLFYVIGHDGAVTQKLVDWLQNADFTGVIFTREKMNGTFTLDQAHLDSPDAPDVLMAFRWSDTPNKYKAVGNISAESSRKPGSGMHGSLSKFDVHNTLVAAGPDFKRGASDDLPTGNIDVAPTILWILGVPPAQPLDGRILFEAMTSGPREKLEMKGNTVSAERDDAGFHWTQYLKFTQLGTHVYLDEGNSGKP